MVIPKEGTYKVVPVFYAFQDGLRGRGLIDSTILIPLKDFERYIKAGDLWLVVKDELDFFLNLPIMTRNYKDFDLKDDMTDMFKKLIEISGIEFGEDAGGWDELFEALNGRIFELIVTYKEIGTFIEVEYDINKI